MNWRWVAIAMVAGAIAAPVRAWGEGKAGDAEDAASLEIGGGRLMLREAHLAAAWTVGGGGLRPLGVTNRVQHRTYALSDSPLFRVEMGEAGATADIDASGLKAIAPLAITVIDAEPGAQCLADRLGGWRASVTLADPQRDGRYEWQLIARKGQNYFREELTIHAGKQDLPVRRVELVDWPLGTPRVVGSTAGSPIVDGDLFCGVEHPSSDDAVVGTAARCGLNRVVPIAAGQSITVSAVIGVAGSGQLRRDFQAYLNLERPRPYQTFLHYNSWYDMGNIGPFGEREALEAINTVGEQLSRRRGVVISSFLFDDGWDNHRSLWDFNSGFPNGFAPLMHAAARFQAGLGVWLSPWGGYAQPKRDRLQYGRAAGYETNSGGFALSGPKYFARFRSVCLEMVRRYGVNQFKFDGTGNVSSRYPGSAYDTDFDAMIGLIQSLRQAKPDLFVNLTTGTWPSPFWTRYADSIWRGGDDHSFAGVGTLRQQWITFRDGQEYHGVVQRGPLFPLNSLMLHGIIYARYARGLADDPGGDFADEVHDYFGTGTQLQELYVTGSLLSAGNWDTLAEAAKWSRANAATLRDVHWVGGDPLRGQVYGFAAWSAAKGILTLRNPTGAPAAIDLEPGQVFELPDDALATFEARSPWASDRDQPVVRLQRGRVHHFALRPWQLMTLEAIAAR